jgi:hypothetical protein
MIMLCSAGTFPLSVAVTGVLVRHVGTTPFFPIAGIFLVVAVLGGNTQRASAPPPQPASTRPRRQPRVFAASG